MSSRRIWIDLDNTPHIPFFLPIIRELEREGHSVVLTARDAYGVCDLAAHHGLAVTTVGRHYGKHRALKVAGTLWRALQLAPVILRERPDISMSHGSRSLVILSGLLRIPSLLLFDYEHAERIPLLRPALGMAPASIDDPSLAKGFRYGVRHYSGLKEDVYAAGFRPDPSILDELGVGPSEILVTIRPPATDAHYHNPEAEGLYVEVVEMLGAIPGVRMVVLPRTAGAQRDFLMTTWPAWCAEKKIVVPERALDGLNLVWHSDLVVSGGGTMNREAAALGVPVYSIFRGKLGAVDRQLAREGRLVLLATRDDVRSKLRVARRAKGASFAAGDRPALRQILAAARELMELSNGRP
ncbi:MAG TPA: DUF354 domain-containing protein [Vicinamibacterales bacterium]|nr:DUF354 domain-containing protein [Vicinamibacterales bacterium]